MKLRLIGLVLLGLLTISGILPMTAINAAVWPNLPTGTVKLTAVDGTSSYFVSTLSGVPAGFDVSDGAYSGWCVDRGTTMVRSVSHDVMLYSSLTPPVEITENWVAINYILNHKQGNMMEVQNAIWHFTDYASTITTSTQAMIDAANDNPTYDPTTGSVLAVICLRQSGSSGVQKIIELTRPRGPGLSPGYWKHNVKVYNGGPGSYSAPYDGMPHETAGTMRGYAATILANHIAEMPSNGVTAEGFLYWVNTQFKSPAKNKMWLTYAN